MNIESISPNSENLKPEVRALLDQMLEREYSQNPHMQALFGGVSKLITHPRFLKHLCHQLKKRNVSFNHQNLESPRDNAVFYVATRLMDYFGFVDARSRLNTAKKICSDLLPLQILPPNETYQILKIFPTYVGGIQQFVTGVYVTYDADEIVVNGLFAIVKNIASWQRKELSGQLSSFLTQNQGSSPNFRDPILFDGIEYYSVKMSTNPFVQKLVTLPNNSSLEGAMSGRFDSRFVHNFADKFLKILEDKGFVNLPSKFIRK